MGISPMHIANLLIESFSKQTFEQGFIHSDLHPGNLFVQYNKKLKKPQLVYLDHGCYEELEEKTRLDYANLWKSIVFRDHEDMKFYTAQLGIDSEFYILFAMFLSAANMLDADKRSLLSTKKQSPLSKEQWRSIAKRLREKYFVGGRSTLEDIIEDMVDKNKTNKSLVLLMRANAQIRNLLYEMGVSINRFRIMAEYCVRGVHIQMRDSTKTIIDNTGHHITIPVKVRRKKPLFERIALLVELFQLRFRLFLFNVFVWLNTFFA
jgi:aarF domain-containing kinase